jgi:TonB family protein
MKTSALALSFILAAVAPTALAVTTETPSHPATTGTASGYIPCKAHQTASASFPIRALHDGVLRGESSMMLEISPTGTVTDSLVTAYTHRFFADEMERTVAKWTFDPGSVDGKPVISILNITFEFSVTGVVVYQKYPGAQTADPFANETYAYYAHGPESLDRKPVAKTISSPIYPQAWIAEGRNGTVTIRFYIDETGHARLPIIVAQSDDLLAQAAVAAVKDWQFEPPTRNGRPVLAHAEQVFVFTPPKTAATKS